MSDSSQPSSALLERLKPVKLLLCDVDGVMTDGTVSIGGGTEYKRFNIQDGLGLRLLQRQGFQVGWVSNRPSPATQQRAEELKIDFLHQQPGNKVAAVESILEQAGVGWGEVCYLGDDLVDLGVLKRVGAPIAVANAIDEVKRQAAYTTRKHGGAGAVREVVELLLKAQDKWSGLITDYTA